MAITTDVIVGFPGETDEEFNLSLRFVRQMEFAGGHVFSYSARPGTPAARYAAQVPPKVQKERSAEMRAAFVEAAQRFKQRFIGQRMDVLWESASSFGPQGWQMEGLTDNYLRVTAASPEKRWNELDAVVVQAVTPDGLSGSIL